MNNKFKIPNLSNKRDKSGAACPILSELKIHLKQQQDVVVFCIGSDRVTGDCLGPMTGELLTSYYDLPAFVYGTLENPITALNLTKIYGGVICKHRFAKIIAIDSCVGKSNDIGKIKVQAGGIYPGLATNKNFPKVGDVGIIGITSDQMPPSAQFASVRLGLIYNQAKQIASAINELVDGNSAHRVNVLKKQTRIAQF